ncbi:MAG TPA: LPXTG cell wall anchor domain-containing protein [Candidatus Polarisedimenticolia bacterium]|jgi:LPXTG-motif cell wall-anchored protein|nr:LPXTG cell wall anchor domain-containing protein [Candidatus Polarisedimenticolia bacterium]
MRKSLLAAAMLVLALTAVLAQESTMITGKVVSVDATGNSFVVESGTDRYTVTTNTTTMFMSGGQHLNLADLKVGDQVSIRGTGTGMSRTATEVTVTTAAENPSGTSYGSSGSSATGTTTTSGSNYSGTSNYNDTTGTTGTSGATTTTTYQSDTGTANTNDTSANGTLPKTGSPAPLIGFAGLLLIGFSLAIRAARKIAH